MSGASIASFGFGLEPGAVLVRFGHGSLLDNALGEINKTAKGPPFCPTTRWHHVATGWKALEYVEQCDPRMDQQTCLCQPKEFSFPCGVTSTTKEMPSPPPPRPQTCRPAHKNHKNPGCELSNPRFACAGRRFHQRFHMSC